MSARLPLDDPKISGFSGDRISRTLIAGVLDISSAFILSYPKGVGPIRVLQGVAAGLVGRESAITGRSGDGRVRTRHPFLIAFVVASVFYMASRKLVFLTRHAVISGLLYGVVIYGFDVLDRHASRSTLSCTLPSREM